MIGGYRLGHFLRFFEQLAAQEVGIVEQFARVRAHAARRGAIVDAVQQRTPRKRGLTEATVCAAMACGPGLIDVKRQRVAIAIDLDALQLLRGPGRFALAPDRFAAAAPEGADPFT